MTASFGRPSVGVGHLLYSSPGCEAKKFELPEGHSTQSHCRSTMAEPSLTVLEIRGAADTYTMAPPSIHPDTGETLKWNGNRRDPLEVPAEQLRALAGQHALAAVVLYFYPENAATRFDVRMALAGALIRSGMNADDAKRYVQAVAYLGHDPKWREDFADHTEQRLEDDKPATGIPKLVEALQLPEACKRTFQEWLQRWDELILDPKDPMRSARKLLANSFVTGGARILHRYREAFWSWTGSYYLLCEDEVIEFEIWTFLEKAKQIVGDPPKLSTVQAKPTAGWETWRPRWGQSANSTSMWSHRRGSRKTQHYRLGNFWHAEMDCCICQPATSINPLLITST